MNERYYLSMFKGEPEVLTVADAARLLRIGKNKAYGLVNEKKLASIHVGGKIIVPKMALVAFLVDAKNYSGDSRLIFQNLWTSAVGCGIVDSADSRTGT